MVSRRKLLRTSLIASSTLPVLAGPQPGQASAANSDAPFSRLQSDSPDLDRSLGQRFDVRDYGALGDGEADDTASFQRATDAMISNGSGHLFFSGSFRINGPIVLAGTNLVGLGILGDGRSTTITQTNENAPVFVVEATDAHSLTIDGFNATWSHDPNPDNSSRSVIQLWDSGNFYNSYVGGITISSAHYFMQSDGMLVWGVVFQNIQQTASTGGFYRLHGTAGQPNIQLSSIYIGAQEMTGPIFSGTGINAEISSVEINQAHKSPTILRDVGGGNYIVGLLGCEAGTWEVEDMHLFHLPDSVLLAEHIFLKGEIREPTTVFRTEGRGFVEVDFLILALTPSGENGNVFLASIGGNGVTNPILNRGEVRIHRVRTFTDLVPWSATGANMVAPVDVANSESANAFSITEWNDPTRICFRGDEDLEVAPGDPRVNIVSVDLTEDRTLKLPDGSLMFTGRAFEFVKASNDGVGAMTIIHHDGSTVAKLAAEEKARCTLVWNRSMENGPGPDTWTVIDRSSW